MANSSLTCVLQHMQKLIGVRRDVDLTDGELLERFVGRQDEAAFEVLVRRHGPLVQRVCRRVLGDAHAAEDAFQAAFLVLARKAGSIRNRSSVGGWLYETAYHLAVRAKSSAARRAWHERQAPDMSLAQAVGADDGDEIHTLLDEELRRLPEKYRTPLVLCYLEGKTNTQAARELGCPAGTMSSLLTRGREMLRDRLAGRGVALSLGALTSLLSADAVSAGVSNALVQNTVQAAVLFAAGRTTVAGIASSQAVFLAEGMLNTMISAKLKFVAGLLVAVGLVGTGASAWMQQAVSAQNPAVAQAAQAAQAAQPGAPAADAKPADARAADARADLHGDPLPEGALVRMGTLRWRHPGAVNFVGYTKDGTNLVTGCTDGLYRVWEVATGKELRRFGKPQAGVNDVNGVIQANGGVQVMIAQANYGQAAALNADGTVLAALGQDGKIHLWDVNSGKDLRTLVSPQNQPFYGNSGMVFTPDGKAIALRANDQSIRLYGVEDGKEIRVIAKGPQAGQNGVVRVFYPGQGGNNMDFSPDGKTLAVIATEIENNRQNGIIQFHDVEGKKEVRKVKGPQNAYAGSVAFANDGKTIAWASTDGLIRLLDAENGKEQKQIGTAQQGVYHSAMLFSPDGKTIASRATNGTAIHLWDVETGKSAKVLGDQPVAGQPFGRVYIQQNSNTLAFSPDGKAIAEGLQNNSVRLWDVATGKETLPVSGHQGGISSLSVSRDGKTLTTFAADGTVRQWDMASGRETAQFKLPNTGMNALLSADGKTVVFGAANNAVKVWDAATGKETRTINVPAQQNFAGQIGGQAGMALSPDGKVLAVRGFDQSTRFFDTASGKEIANASEAQANNNPNNGIVAFAPVYYGGRGTMVFGPDNVTLATVGMSQAAMQNGFVGGARTQSSVVRLWNARTGKPSGRFETTRGVAALAFSPDGRTIATANTDNTISLWEILSGKECLTITVKAAQAAAPNPAEDENRKRIMELAVMRGQQGGSIVSLSFANDGRTLAAASGDKSVRLFELPNGKEIGAFTGHVGAVTAVAFAPDSKTVITGSADTTAMVWAGDRYIKAPTVESVQLEQKQLDSLWQELAGEPNSAYKARIQLATAPKQTLALLQDKVKPTAGVDVKEIEKLIADLESNQFEVREKANTELEKLGELAQPALQKVLDAQPSLETRQRVDRILEQLTTGQAPPPEVLRNIRAVQLLEQMASPEAKQLLQSLAKGAPGDKVTRQAEAALKRLGS